jgi:hypothetical protein
LEGATQIALNVIAAENSLAGCICVYPGDDTTCCMVPGSSLKYEASYFAPYWLQGTVDEYPNITNNNLVGQAGTVESVIFSAGESFVFNIEAAEGDYSIEAIRIFNLPLSNYTELTITNLNQQPLCSNVIRTTQEGAFGSLLDWNLNDATGTLVTNAHQCQSFSCINMRAQPQYLAFCGISVESQNCIDYKQTVCDQDPTAVYWPLDSLAKYPNCQREADLDGCVCCKLDTVNTAAQTINNKIVVNVTQGEIEIGQIRFYGLKDTIQPVPLGLKSYLNTVSGTDTNCTDERFMNQFLNGDGTAYAPNENNEESQEKRTYDQAFQRCLDTGGNLAVSENLLDPSDVSILQRTCELLSNENQICWVGAQDRQYNSLYTTRDLMFRSGCTTYGCYTVQSGNAVFSFNPEITTTTYLTPAFSNQAATFTIYLNYLRTVDKFETEDLPPLGGPGQISRFTTPELTLNYYSHVTNCRIDFCTTGSCREVLYSFTFDSRNANKWGIPIYLKGANGAFPRWRRINMTPNRCAYINFFTTAYCSETSINRFARNEATIKASTGSQSYNNNDWSRVFGDLPCVQFFPNIDRLPNQIIEEQTRDGKTIRRSVPDPNRPRFYSYTLKWATPTISRGTVGIDYVPGIFQKAYIPAFIQLKRNLEAIDPVEFVATGSGQNLVSSTTPVYFTNNNINKFNPTYSRFVVNKAFTDDELTDAFGDLSNTIDQCSQCPLDLIGEFAWDQVKYSEFVWQDEFTSSVPVNIFLNVDNLWTPLADVQSSDVDLFTHQTVTISDKTSQPNPPVNWNFNSCLAVSSEGLVGFVCVDQLQNFVCQYNFVQYTTQPGTQCDVCGKKFKIYISNLYSYKKIRRQPRY